MSLGGKRIKPHARDHADINGHAPRAEESARPKRGASGETTKKSKKTCFDPRG
jgi:hypothetical protein